MTDNWRGLAFFMPMDSPPTATAQERQSTITRSGKRVHYKNARLQAAEDGLLGKHPTTGQPIASLFVNIGNSYANQANRLWVEIFQIVKENCASLYEGNDPHEDVMEQLLSIRKWK